MALALDFLQEPNKFFLPSSSFFCYESVCGGGFSSLAESGSAAVAVPFAPADECLNRPQVPVFP